MDFKVQRFTKGHPLYSEQWITNDIESKGVVGTFRSVFGQAVTMDGELIDYTMERLDTLIPAGTYQYDIYKSPTKGNVIRLTKNPQGNDISARELEHHIANFPYQLKGCCAHGKSIDVHTPELLQSKDAIVALMAIAGTSGTITYEDFTINT